MISCAARDTGRCICGDERHIVNLMRYGCPREICGGCYLDKPHDALHCHRCTCPGGCIPPVGITFQNYPRPAERG